MNAPGQASGNWRRRITNDVLSPAAFDWLLHLTSETNRRAVNVGVVESTSLLHTEVTR